MPQIVNFLTGRVVLNLYGELRILPKSIVDLKHFADSSCYEGRDLVELHRGEEHTAPWQWNIAEHQSYRWFSENRT